MKGGELRDPRARYRQKKKLSFEIDNDTGVGEDPPRLSVDMYIYRV